MEQDVFEKLIKQKEFEWDTIRYKQNKNLSTKEGHAKKHLIEKKDEQQKWKKYHGINISQSFQLLVDTYEKISINNIKENKSDKTKRYFDSKNHSLNITDSNGLETCLKKSKSKNKLVISTCFYRDKIRDFIRDYNEKIPFSYLATTKFMTINEILSSNQELKQYKEFDEIDLNEIITEFYKSLKYNKSDNIKKMIESYENFLSFNTKTVEEEIIQKTNELNNIINEIKEEAKQYNIIFEEYQEKEYIPVKEEDIFNIEEIEKEVEFLIEQLEKEKENEKNISIKEEFVKTLDYYELLDSITDLMIYYIYIRLSEKYDLLKDYENKIYFFKQLDTFFNELSDTIKKFEKYVRHEEIINNNLYQEDTVYTNFKTHEEILKEKYDLDEIKDNIKKSEKEYQNKVLIISKKCLECNKISYIHQLTKPQNNKLEEIYKNNHQPVERDECPYCKSKNIEIIMTNAELYRIDNDKN